MKKWWICLPLLLVLSGCGTPKDYETMADQYLEPEPPAAAAVRVQLPEDASVMTISEDTAGTIYLCDCYSVTVQTLASGDLDATLRSVTGYGAGQLQLYKLEQEGLKRYECVWAAAGEGGDQVGKAVILDDGSYHYAVTVFAPAEQAGELAETWHEILGSVSLER